MRKFLIGLVLAGPLFTPSLVLAGDNNSFQDSLVLNSADDFEYLDQAVIIAGETVVKKIFFTGAFQTSTLKEYSKLYDYVDEVPIYQETYDAKLKQLGKQANNENLPSRLRKLLQEEEKLLSSFSGPLSESEKIGKKERLLKLMESSRGLGVKGMSFVKFAGRWAIRYDLGRRIYTWTKTEDGQELTTSVSKTAIAQWAKRRYDNEARKVKEALEQQGEVETSPESKGQSNAQ